MTCLFEMIIIGVVASVGLFPKLLHNMTFPNPKILPQCERPLPLPPPPPLLSQRSPHPPQTMLPNLSLGASSVGHPKRAQCLNACTHITINCIYRSEFSSFFCHTLKAEELAVQS